ncbi:MAG: heme ABC exporter ATP-binding protein CcmA [Gammaproteobacteria bacterium]|nr:heme ABC exporter ATP-binding protein CcmA [Gammaproteobacteria bacterium]
MNDSLLVAEDLRCIVGPRALFVGLSFTVEPGDLIEVRGANGSGKSTLLRCLVGLAAPESGDVHRRVEAQYLGHRSGNSGRMTPHENLRWIAGLRGVERDSDSIDDALARVGLGDAGHAMCDSLSVGQQRRVSLARLLVAPSPLWILDEPLTSLDDAGVELVRELLAEHRSRGGGAVCATHRALTLGSAAARVVALSRGAPGAPGAP